MSASSTKAIRYTARGRRVRTARDYLIYVVALALAVGGVVAILSLF
ncbi:hypothetical protein [Naasia lichenicola]|nr:hypothetical protein [Naasia lichenicola]